MFSLIIKHYVGEIYIYMTHKGFLVVYLLSFTDLFLYCKLNSKARTLHHPVAKRDYCRAGTSLPQTHNSQFLYLMVRDSTYALSYGEHRLGVNIYLSSIIIVINLRISFKILNLTYCNHCHSG